MKRRLFSFTRMGIVFMTVLACGCLFHPPGPGSSKERTTSPASGSVESRAPGATTVFSVRDILLRPRDFSGQTVNVRGIYKGWRGDCAGKPPRTRSDWMLQDDGHCMYVTGGTPSTIRPGPESSSIGEQVIFPGTIRVDSEGRCYIEYAGPH